MTVVLTGCPTPPPGYQPPSLESTQITPQPAQPGDTVTMVLDVRDDQAVNHVAPRILFTPSNTKLNPADVCDVELAPQGDFRHVLATVACRVPTYASNGTWQLELLLNDSSYPNTNYPGRTVRIPFEVTGGSDDRRPPQLVSYSIDPVVVDQETAFTVTARLRDESLPLSVGYGGGGTFGFYKRFATNSLFWCVLPTITQVSATEVDMVATCTPSNYNQFGRSEAGQHVSLMPVQDALGHEGTVEMNVDVQPGP
jgi:hypothetical protein